MFFFSSRRRHTRSKRDWSSDVCSSDLIGGNGERVVPAAVRVGEEVISGLQVAIASGQVEAEVPDRGLAERGRGSARLAGGQGVGGGFRRGAWSGRSGCWGHRVLLDGPRTAGSPEH